MAAFELINKALAQGMDQINASSGSDEPGFMAVGTHPETGEMYAVSNNEGIGWGATPNYDGATALQHPSTTAVRNTSMEVLEHKSPIFHERLELRQDSAGAGTWRGGLGICREVRFLATGEMLSMKKKTKTKPWALKGGHEPETNAMIVWPETERAHRARMERFTMQPGNGSATCPPAAEAGATPWSVLSSWWRRMSSTDTSRRSRPRRSTESGWRRTGPPRRSGSACSC